MFLRRFFLPLMPNCKISALIFFEQVIGHGTLADINDLNKTMAASIKPYL